MLGRCSSSLLAAGTLRHLARARGKVRIPSFLTTTRAASWAPTTNARRRTFPNNDCSRRFSSTAVTDTGAKEPGRQSGGPVVAVGEPITVGRYGLEVRMAVWMLRVARNFRLRGHYIADIDPLHRAKSMQGLYRRAREVHASDLSLLTRMSEDAEVVDPTLFGLKDAADIDRQVDLSQTQFVQGKNKTHWSPRELVE